MNWPEMLGGWPEFNGEVRVLLSMTGYGEARCQGDRFSASVEVRALNNRHLKVSLRASDPYHLLEPEVEKAVRRVVRRGTLQIHLRIERQTTTQDFRIDVNALESYVDQVRAAAEKLGLRDHGQALLGQVLALPGVVPEAWQSTTQLHDDWPTLEKVLDEALKKLQEMRREEGRAMAIELLANRDTIEVHLQRIRAKAVEVAPLYRQRLLERTRAAVAELDIKIDQSDLIKEVSIFAERSDIAEEIVRLASHLNQFQTIINEPESAGRKLEFLTQEMFRETNTIGSKASDVQISHEVVEIKSTLEKIRELVLNVE